VASVDGETITLNTNQGRLTVSVGAETTIQQTVTLGLAQLQNGMQVAAVGERNDDGTVSAVAITIVPEGSDGAPPGFDNGPS
jgi:hypothetical protein|tara:strand:- start:1767 stop:2012 length:246 start_codon:yes stop_codon:yes gene_type:complete